MITEKKKVNHRCKVNMKLSWAIQQQTSKIRVPTKSREPNSLFFSRLSLTNFGIFHDTLYGSPTLTFRQLRRADPLNLHLPYVFGDYQTNILSFVKSFCWKQENCCNYFFTANNVAQILSKFRFSITFDKFWFFHDFV